MKRNKVHLIGYKHTTPKERDLAQKEWERMTKAQKIVMNATLIARNLTPVNVMLEYLDLPPIDQEKVSLYLDKRLKGQKEK